MKGKDRRIVNVVIPATETSPEISFDISLSDLQNALKNAIDNNYKTITFRVGDKTADLSISHVSKIIKMAKSQFAAQVKVVVPKILKKYLTDMSSSKMTILNEKLSARDEEIEKLWTCLCSMQKSNAILVGEQGVGKTTMAIEVVRQINLKECPTQLSNYTVLELDTLKLLELAQTSRFKYQLVLNSMLEFLKENKKRMIVYIDNLLHAKCELLFMKCFMLLVKRYNVKIIASISLEDFNEFFMNDAPLMKYLNPILLEEPAVDEIYPMLKTRIDNLQKKYGVKISDKMIRFSILTGIHLSSSNSANPESTLDIVNFALADAKRREQKEVIKSNILAYYYINFKLDKKTNLEEKKRYAYHEAGHYIVAKMAKNMTNIKNAFVSILPIGGAGGLTAVYFTPENSTIDNKEYYIDDIAYSLGGRVGEAILTKDFSSGARSDLESANEMAEQVILSYGLSSRESEKNKSYTLGGGMYIKDYLLTDELRKDINKEISDLMSEAYKRAEKIINENRELFEEIVKRLLEEGVLMGDELEEICDQYSERNLIS